MILNFLLTWVVLLLLAGLALDTGLLQRRSLLLQSATDAAAQEAMSEKARNNSAWKTAGATQATANGFTTGINGTTVTIVSPPASGAYAGDASSVQATLTQTGPNLFMGLVHGGNSTISVSATAKMIPTCLWILNPSSSSTASLSLTSTTFSASCGVFVNTASGTNLGVDSASSLTSPRIRVVGPSSGNGSAGVVTRQPKFGAAVKNDPLAYVTAPVFSSCSYTNQTIANYNGPVNPGTYCNVTVSNSNATLSAGLYIFAGTMSVSNSTLSGTGVTLYFTQGGGYGYGPVTMTSTDDTGKYTLNLKAPTSTANGGIPGVAMFADRNWVGHGTQGIQISHMHVNTDGFWYFPNVGLKLQQVTYGYYTYSGLVVDNLVQSSNASSFNANYANLGGISPLHYEDGLLVQ